MNIKELGRESFRTKFLDCYDKYIIDIKKQVFSYNLLVLLGVECMRELAQDRAVQLGEFIAQTGATVRAAGKMYGISKSTVHKDVTERLQHSDPQLYERVKAVLDKNKSERHIRGGMATKRKYKGEHRL